MIVRRFTLDKRKTVKDQA